MTKEVFTMFTDLSPVFDEKYRNDPNFFQRLSCWSGVIGKYLNPGDVVMDIGCGTGVFSFYAASKGAEVTGIDGSEGMINLCNEKLSKNHRQSPLKIRFSMDTLPLADSHQYPKADMIICSSVFEYVRETERLIENFSALLKENGILLLSVPNKSSLYRYVEKASYLLTGKPAYLKHVFNRYTLPELTALFKQHNFQAMEKHYYASNYLFSGMLKAISKRERHNNLLLVVFQKKNNKSA